ARRADAAGEGLRPVRGAVRGRRASLSVLADRVRCKERRRTGKAGVFDGQHSPPLLLHRACEKSAYGRGREETFPRWPRKPPSGRRVGVRDEGGHGAADARGARGAFETIL